MKYFLIVAGLLLLVNAAMMVIIADFTMGIVLQVLVSLLLIIYAFRYKRLPKAVHITIGLVCATGLVFMAFLAIYGNADNARYDEDVVIVLGAGLYGEQVSLTLGRRLDEAVAYHAENPAAVIIVCGGQGSGELITEALAMERYLMARGVPQEKIIKEEKSTSTYENCAFARELLTTRFTNGFSSVLITSDFHVYRASRLAQYAGIPVRHIGSRTEWYTIPVNYFREICAVFYMWIAPPAMTIE